MEIEGTTAGPIAQQPLVVDSSVSCQNAAPALAARGVKVVMRYYSLPDYPLTILSAAEATAIHGSGMAIGLVYQYKSGNIAHFSPRSAHDAAAACMSRDAGLNPGKPETIYHPKGTAIYFGVDGDLTGGNDANINTILDFFKIIGEDFAAKQAPFEIGVYGSGDACERLVGQQAKYGWIAGVSTGWTRTREVYNESAAPHWHIFQNALEVPLDVPVDTNLVNPRTGGLLGAFDKTGLIGPLNDSGLRTKLRFIKTGAPALFFKKKGEEPIIHQVDWDDSHHQHHVDHRNFIEPARMVTVLDGQSDWSKVEVTFANNNVGTVYQGYVRSTMLAPVDQMP
jgi:hypothetical protein